MNKMKQIKMLVLDVDGTMTDGKINIMEDGNHFKQFDSKDGLGIKMLIKKGIIVGIISHSTFGKAIETRAKMLGIKYVYAGMEEKDIILNGWLSELDFGPESVAFIGDDLNDLPAMKIVAVSACPSDANAEVISYVDIVLKNKGGHGSVREFIDEHLGITYQPMK